MALPSPLLEDAMVTSEKEMVRKLVDEEEKPEDRFTSLQATYEDSIPPSAEDEWDDRD